MSSFSRAVRHRAKARIGLSGPSGSGKTYSALMLAKGLGKKVAMIDTENHSGELYADILEYDIAVLNGNYSPDNYVKLIKEAEAEKYDVIVIDSLTHAWAGEGGVLDIVDKKMDYEKNKFAAWRTVTPKHNRLVETILQSPCHIIATMRAKHEYEQGVDERGKKKITRIGMAPIMRDGIEYEFTLFGELSIENHLVQFTKDRTRLFDGQPPFRVTEQTGKELVRWLNSGAMERQIEAEVIQKNAEAIIPLTIPSSPEIPPVPRVATVTEAPSSTTQSLPAVKTGTGTDISFWNDATAAQLRVGLEKLSLKIGKEVTLDDSRAFIHEMFGLDSHKKLKKHQFQILQDWINRSWKKGMLDSYLPKVD